MRDVEEAGFVVRMEDVSEEDWNDGCRSLGYVVKGKEAVRILVFSTALSDPEHSAIGNSNVSEGTLLMLLHPRRKSWWPWSPYSSDLCDDVAHIMVMKGAQLASDPVEPRRSSDE